MRFIAALMAVCMVTMPVAVSAAVPVKLKPPGPTNHVAAASRPVFAVVPDEAFSLDAKLRPHLTAQGRTWVAAEAAAVHEGSKSQAQVEADAAVTPVDHIVIEGMGLDGDVQSLAFLVMMEAAQSSQDDLRDTLTNMQSINAAKAKQRSSINAMQTAEQATKSAASSDYEKTANDGQVNPSTSFNAFEASASFSYDDIKATQVQVKGQLDSMNEMSEMTSMRLQMAMDRRSKFVEALSNIMKKIDSTQETIVQNLK